MSDMMEARHGRRRARAGEGAKGGQRRVAPPRKVKPGMFRPSQGANVPDKVMEGLGYRKAHPVEGKAYFPKGAPEGAVKKFATKHAGKLAKAMSGAKLGLRALGRASAGIGAVVGAHDIGVAGREGMKALKLHSEAKMNAKEQKRKYGTIEAATRTRHARNKK